MSSGRANFAYFFASLLLMVQVALAQESGVDPIQFTELSVSQVSRYDAKIKKPFAYLLELKLGSVTLKSDTPVVHPVSGERESLVGAMSAFQWNGNPSSSMELSFVVSAENAKRIENYLRQPGPSSEVEFNFQIFSPDSASTTPLLFLKSFSYPFRGVMNRVGSEMPSNENKSLPLKGDLQPRGGRLSLEVDPTSRVVKMVVLPRKKSPPQNLILRRSGVDKEKVRWGG